MATVNINGSTYEWPDSGDKNWAANVTRVIQKVAVEIDRNRTTAAKQGDNNVFTAANRFTTVPTVGVSNDNANNVALATLDNITTASSSLSTEVTEELTTLRNLLGVTSTPTTSELFNISGFSDFFKTLGGISNNQNNANLLNVLNAIMGYLRSLEPIGTIKPVYNQTDLPTLRWKYLNNSDATAPHDNAIWLHTLAGSAFTDGIEEGWYEPEPKSGLWALCDGKHPLPIQPFGFEGAWNTPEYLSHGKRKAYYTPNMLDAVLQGAATGTRTTTGENLLSLEVDNLPAHSHDLSEYRVTGNFTGGEHRHYISAQSDVRTQGKAHNHEHFMSFQKDFGEGTLRELSPATDGTLLTVPTRTATTPEEGLTDFGGHTHELRATDGVRIVKPPQDVEDQTGRGDSVDVGDALKRLPVKFYMKVAE